MRTTRRNFLRVAAASGAFASLTDRSWPISPDGLQTKLDRRHAITTRVYRKPDGPLRLKLADKDLASLTSLSISQVQPISPDRLTS